MIPGYTVEDVEGSLQNAVKEAQLHLHPEQEPRVFSDSSIRRIQQKAKPEVTTTTVEKGSQNRRRYQAINDAYNAFSRVIVWMVMLKSLGCNILDVLNFNTDKSSHYLNDDTKMILLSALGITAELDALHRNPTTTKTGKEEKARGYAYTPINNVQGENLAWTTHITDHAFNVDGEVKTYKLDDTRYLQTIPTGPKPSSSETIAFQQPEVRVRVPPADTVTVTLATVARETNDQLPEDNVRVDTSVALSHAEIEQEKLDDLLRDKFGAQEADQYIRLIYIPVMEARRKKCILDDYHTDNFATVPLTQISSGFSHMGFMSQEDLVREAGVEAKEKLAHYRILATIDGERNGNNCLKRLYEEQSPSPMVLALEEDHADNLPETVDLVGSDSDVMIPLVAASDMAVSQPEVTVPFDNLLVWKSKMQLLNADFMKHSGSCSKIEQLQDVIRGGFMTCHQFLNSPMFQNFNTEVRVHIVYPGHNHLSLKFIIYRRRPYQPTCPLSINCFKMYRLPHCGHSNEHFKYKN